MGEYFDRCLECAYQIDKFKEYAGKELAISFSELDRVFKEGLNVPLLVKKGLVPKSLSLKDRYWALNYSVYYKETWDSETYEVTCDGPEILKRIYERNLGDNK